MLEGGWGSKKRGKVGILAKVLRFVNVCWKPLKMSSPNRYLHVQS